MCFISRFAVAGPCSERATCVHSSTTAVRVTGLFVPEISLQVIVLRDLHSQPQ